MESKRILIVDDEPNVTLVLAKSLKKLQGSYVVDIANNADDALNKLVAHHYVLVLTDYRMPAMTGLDLAQVVRHVSPDTQIVLMTAYGTESLRDTVDRLEFDGYLDKPFTMAQIREVVERAVNATSLEDPYRTGEWSVDEQVLSLLQSLRSDTGAHCVMLLSASGYPIEVVGAPQSFDVGAIGALVAANFMAAMELSRLLSNGSIFKSSYHEGPDYNVYSYAVNEATLLAVIFGGESKPGAVWFFAKQAAALLARFDLTQPTPIEFEAGALTDDLNRELDYLFNAGPENADGADTLMDVSQAIAAGLIPSNIFNTEAQD